MTDQTNNALEPVHLTISDILHRADTEKPLIEKQVESAGPMECAAREVAANMLESGHHAKIAAEAHLSSCTALADQIVKAAIEVEKESNRIISKINKAEDECKNILKEFLADRQEK